MADSAAGNWLLTTTGTSSLPLLHQATIEGHLFIRVLCAIRGSFFLLSGRHGMNLPAMCSALVFGIAVLAAAATAHAADDADELFKKSVRPLFERKCFDCHSSKADEVKSNLKLETPADVLKGGDNGPAVVAGDLENSFLLRAIRYQVEDYQMPPSGRLSDEEIAAVEAWVKALDANAKRRGLIQGR